MGILTDIGNGVGFGDLDRSQNEFRDVDERNFNLPGFANRRDGLDRQGDKFLGRQAGHAEGGGEFRDSQQYALGRLRALANGDDSFAREQSKVNQAQMAAQQRAMAAGASPSNQAAALRMSMANTARGAQGMNQQSTMAQIAERNAALAGIGGLSTNARGQDIQNNQFNVNADQNQQRMNQEGWLATQGLGLQNAQAQQTGTMGYEQQRGNRFNGLLNNPTTGERALGAITGLAGAGLKIAMAPSTGGASLGANESAVTSPGYTPDAYGQPMNLQSDPNQFYAGYQAQPVGYNPSQYGQPMQLTSDERTKTNVRRILPGELSRSAPSGEASDPRMVRPEELSRARREPDILSRERKEVPVSSRARKTPDMGEALPAPKLTSDKKTKTNIASIAHNLDSLTTKLKPHTYEYKDERLGKGPRIGVMAQDVELGGPLGADLVDEEDGIKKIDMPKSMGTALALIGRLSERLDKLEKK